MNTYYFYKWEIRSGHLVLYIILKRKKGEKIVRDRKAYPLCLVSQRMKIDALHVINLTLFEPQCICRLSVLRGTNEVISFYINYIQREVERREKWHSLFFLNIICCVCVIVWMTSLFLLVSSFCVVMIFNFLTCGRPPVGSNQLDNR